MRPTRKLDTRYDRREKYSNFILLDPAAIVPLLAVTGVILYYTGKGISKVSGRTGKAATNTTRNVLVGLAAIVVYLKIKDNRFEKNNESNEETYNPSPQHINDLLYHQEENILETSDPKRQK